ncbi:hypothetical protein [uncultured Dysgonomonas sp.]|uniref:hypothetical protein n=1 Tax=uncultured Dysgonomonas sp. TaxID=206096 RepID=UPI0025E9C42C|nr:hypothetical protein [uncultured Dysgonomonas sp.]
MEVTITNGAIVFVICCSLVGGILLERYTSKRTKYIEILESHIQRQDSLINQLRTDKDRLRITRAEFDEAVKLLNEKK